ncbi:MAG: hypothetical protein GY849_19995, partial [Deltaproteobacteria bacterium]|nr:hypothetical protein [Deltaproteobacteria bacterium]
MKTGKLLSIMVVFLVWGVLLFSGVANAQYDWEGGDPDIYYVEGNVGIGTSEPSAILHIASDEQPILEKNKDAAGASQIACYKSRGTHNSPTASLVNDRIGAFNAFSYDGTEFKA